MLCSQLKTVISKMTSNRFLVDSLLLETDASHDGTWRHSHKRLEKFGPHQNIQILRQ